MELGVRGSNRTSVRGQLVEQSAMEDVRKAGSLEERFLKAAGADAQEVPKIGWLEAAS